METRLGEDEVEHLVEEDLAAAAELLRVGVLLLEVVPVVGAEVADVDAVGEVQELEQVTLKSARKIWILNWKP